MSVARGDWPLAETHPRTKGKNDEDQDGHDDQGDREERQDEGGEAGEGDGEAGRQKLSQIEAAVAVLAKAGEAMNCKAMVEAMAKQGLWNSPGGATPDATLYASILRDINTKGKEARFKKVDRGQFALVGRK